MRLLSRAGASSCLVPLWIAAFEFGISAICCLFKPYTATKHLSMHFIGLPLIFAFCHELTTISRTNDLLFSGSADQRVKVFQPSRVMVNFGVEPENQKKKMERAHGLLCIVRHQLLKLHQGLWVRLLRPVGVRPSFHLEYPTRLLSILTKLHVLLLQNQQLENVCVHVLLSLCLSVCVCECACIYCVLDDKELIALVPSRFTKGYTRSRVHRCVSNCSSSSWNILHVSPYNLLNNVYEIMYIFIGWK